MYIKRSLLVAVLITAVTIGGGNVAHAEAPGHKPAATTATPAPVKVVVKEGDTLSDIATSHSTNYVRIYDANDAIADPNIINPGQDLRIPKDDEQLPDRPLPTPPAPDVAPVAAPAAAPQPVTAAPAPRPAAAPVYSSTGGDVWNAIAACESGGNWAINTGNGFYGGLQFTLSSWRGVGGSGYPNEASPEEQIARAQILQSRQGWGAWPACTAKLGIR